MSQIVSKTDQLRAHVAVERWDAALRIAKTFRIGLSKEQRDIFVRAHEAQHHPRLMAQIGKDPAACIAAGIALLRQLYPPKCN